MDLLEIMYQRRSVRKYTGEPIPQDKIDRIIKAGLLSASGRRIKPWEFVVVREKETLKNLAKCRTGAANMLTGADCAIVVLAKEGATDVWVEDCSITMENMHLMADSLGVGSCWIQGRLREAEGGMTTEDYVKELLSVPEDYHLEAILSLGMPEEKPAAYTEDDLVMEKVHLEKF